MILFYYKVGGQYEGKNPNNYIWFNNELWRIIGVFDESSHGQSGQNLVKIIRNESIGGLVWDKSSTNDWSTSSLKILLNENYYNATDGTESGNCYGYSTSAPSNCDYTGNGQGTEWTITPNSSSSYNVFNVSSGGRLNYNNADLGNSARPVLYLDSNVYVIDGNGSISDPYIIGM